MELFRSDAGTPVSLAVQSADGVVNSSTDNPFRIRVKRDATDLWIFEYDDGALGSYTLGGSVIDATYATCSHFGVRIEQSSAAGAVNNHFFDDFVVGPIPVDGTPPSIVSVTATSATNVDVFYDEPIDPGFVGGYDIIPFIGVSAQVLDGVDPTLVHVTPAIALTNGNTYSLSAGGAQDVAGNGSLPSMTDFTYVVPAEAGYRSVVINDLLADITPQIGLPNAEFIELFNSSSTDSYDLAGWTITDGSTIGVLPSTILTPGQFAILTDDANAALFTGLGIVVPVPTFPSLNDTGDPLVLRDDGGTLIDAVTDDPSWYQDAIKDDGGWSLEQIDPTTPCRSAANWIASNDPQGGTPGEQNSGVRGRRRRRSTCPSSVQVNSATEIDLLFSEAMDTTSLESGSYVINTDPSGQHRRCHRLGSRATDLGTPLVVGQLYTITVTAVSDCPGNTIGPRTQPRSPFRSRSKSATW